MSFSDWIIARMRGLKTWTGSADGRQDRFARAGTPA
jgi:hypothetical protein